MNIARGDFTFNVRVLDCICYLSIGKLVELLLSLLHLSLCDLKTLQSLTKLLFSFTITCACCLQDNVQISLRPHLVITC